MFFFVLIIKIRSEEPLHFVENLRSTESCKEVGRIEQEELFMQELTEVLKEKHPDWNLESKEE